MRLDRVTRSNASAPRRKSLRTRTLQAPQVVLSVSDRALGCAAGTVTLPSAATCQPSNCSDRAVRSAERGRSRIFEPTSTAFVEYRQGTRRTTPPSPRRSPCFPNHELQIGQPHAVPDRNVRRFILRGAESSTWM